MHFFYLHGFASSPESAKARFYRDRLAALGVTLHCPDLNLPDFPALTVSRMIGQIEDALERMPAGPVTLLGSSLGGFTALHAADRWNRTPGTRHPVDRLILLAPAFDFCSPREPRLTAADIEQWRVEDRRTVFHYAEERESFVRYGLYADAQRYDSEAVRLDIPILVFQGTRDEVVLPQSAIAFASTRPHVTLCLLDDDHLLRNHLEEMWTESARFLGLATHP